MKTLDLDVKDKLIWNNLFYDLFDNEEFKQFIKTVVRLFRQSPEYKKWLDMITRDECPLTNLSYEEDGAEIEVHHYNKTIYEVTEEICERFLDEELPFNSSYMVMLLIELHFTGCIDYIPILHCVHKMAHKNLYRVMELYPDLEEHVHYGNKELYNKTIDNYVNFLKKMLNKE